LSSINFRPDFVDSYSFSGAVPTSEKLEVFAIQDQ